MNELVSVPISPWYTIPAAVGLLALTFVFTPGVLLHLGVLLYPKGHARRREFTAELYKVPYIKRPFWVAGTLVRCLFEGVPARIQSIRSRRTTHKQPIYLQDIDLGKEVRVLACDQTSRADIALFTFLAFMTRFKPIVPLLRWSYRLVYPRGRRED